VISSTDSGTVFVPRRTWHAPSYNGTCRVFNTKDDQATRAIVGHTTDTCGNVERAGSTALKLNGCRLTTRNKRPQAVLVHRMLLPCCATVVPCSALTVAPYRRIIEQVSVLVNAPLIVL
jgi:hypothetical protein